MTDALIESGAYGYRTRVLRAGSAMPWVGAVAVPEGHSWFGLDGDRAPRVIGIPGGITCGAPDEERAGIWWLSFDLGHVSVPASSNTSATARALVALLAIQAATAGAAWSGERPTAEGAFWWRVAPEGIPWLARVEDVFGDGRLAYELWDDCAGGFVRLHDDAIGQWASREAAP